MSPIEFLKSHFEALEPRAVQIKGLPFPLLYQPLTAEQALKYAAATRSRVPKEQGALFAELLVDTVLLAETGKPAFPFGKDLPNPVEVLTKKTPPVIFTRLVNNLGFDTDTKDVEDLEKKSEPQGQASSCPSTSSQSSENAPSRT